MSTSAASTSTFDASRPFVRADALRAGIRISDLTGPRYQRLFHGIYISAAVRTTPQVRARAALLIAPPGSHVSHHTAARLWGGMPPNDPTTHISVPAKCSRSERVGITAHVAIHSPELQKRYGLPVSSPAQCFCEVAGAGADLVDLVVLADSLIKAKAVSAESLVAAADNWRHRGAARASRAARLARVGVDSPQESRLRMLILLAGLPEPEVNVIMRHENGDWKRRFELCYRDLKLLIEYDGGQHVTDSAQRARDLERREELEHLGWRIITIQKEHLYGQPQRVLERIAQARLDCGAAKSTCRIRTTWRQHFPH